MLSIKLKLKVETLSDRIMLAYNCTRIQADKFIVLRNQGHKVKVAKIEAGIIPLPKII